MPALMECRGDCGRKRSAVQHDLAGIEAVQTEDRPQQFGAARADEARDADDLSPAYPHIHAVEAGRAQVRHLQYLVVRGCPGARIAGIEGSPDHVAHDDLNVLQPHFMRDDRAVPQDSDLVAERESVLEVVADIDDRKAASLQTPDLREQHLAFGRRKRGRRFVEDDEARFAPDGSCDFEQAAGRRGSGPRTSVAGSRSSPTVASRSLRAPDQGIAPKDRPVRSEPPKKQIFRNRQIVDQGAVLVNDRDAMPLGVDGRVQAHGMPVEEYLAVVGRVDPADDLDQRRLAGSVLPEQGMNLAREERDRDIPGGCDARKSLGDPRSSTNGATSVMRPLLPASFAECSLLGVVRVVGLVDQHDRHGDELVHLLALQDGERGRVTILPMPTGSCATVALNAEVPLAISEMPSLLASKPMMFILS